MDIEDGAKTRTQMCDQCPFSGKGIDLGAEKMAEIRQYLSQGQNHFCHKDDTNRTICRGGRNYQLRLWHSLRMIDEPTDEALRKAFEKVGIKPKSHI